jgi:carbamoyl-phosphate synthase large subunit
MVELATKCCLGQKLQDMGFGIGLYPVKDIVAVKVPVFSFEKLHDVDTSLGPEMKSTGEVLGIAKTFSEAVHKGFLGSYINIPAKGNILLTVADGLKQELVPLAAKLEKMGFKLYATEKTCQTLNRHQIKTEAVKKIGNGEPNLMTMLDGGELDLVIITPTKGREAKRDGFQIRRKAVEKSVPCLTSLDTAWALVKSIDHHHGNGQVNVVELGSI